MAEIKSFSVPTLAEGVAELGAGVALMESRSRVSEFLRLPTSDPNQYIIDLPKYHALVQAIGKFTVDGVISWGFDLGGAMMVIGSGELLRASVFRNEPVAQDLWNFCVVGFMGATALLGEIYDLAVLASQNKCSWLGCGDFVDLAIFAGMTAYPFIVRRMRQGDD